MAFSGDALSQGAPSLGEEGAMSVPLAPQAQAILRKSDVGMITERVEDVGPAHQANGHEGLAGGLGPVYPTPLDAPGD